MVPGEPRRGPRNAGGGGGESGQTKEQKGNETRKVGGAGRR